MRGEIGILLIEDRDGGISVQLFSDRDKLEDSFNNLRGKAGQEGLRATYIGVDYLGKFLRGKVKDLGFKGRDFSIWRLGGGELKEIK